ncbi:MAG: glycogen synthase, partial [Actinobacteria bacterium]|nr:glycogen synthase [Actinomycetota bacterium]
MSDLKVGIVTKEWPPAIYGGAGVHVLQLTQALRSIDSLLVEVHCFGEPREDASAYATSAEFVDANPAVQALAIDLEIAS